MQIPRNRNKYVEKLNQEIKNFKVSSLNCGICNANNYFVISKYDRYKFG